MSLKRYSVAELQAELERRKTEVTPTPLTNPDFSQLTDYVTSGVHKIAKDRCKPKDFDHYVYELALVAIYGPGILNWYNNTAE